MRQPGEQVAQQTDGRCTACDGGRRGAEPPDGGAIADGPTRGLRGRISQLRFVLDQVGQGLCQLDLVRVCGGELAGRSEDGLRAIMLEAVQLRG